MAEITLKGTPIHTSGHLPTVGEKAPPFRLIDNDLQEKSLQDFAGKKKILSIVPSLDTSVCSLSAKKWNEKVSQRHDVVVLVVSADLPFAQKRFCGSENAKNIVTLSMMRDKTFAQDFGVLIQDGPLTGLCARAIVALDEQDRVVYTELVSEITTEPNYDKALDAIS